MADPDSGFDAAWRAARGRLFPPIPGPTRAETEAFTQRVLARLPEEAAAWRPWRWLAPSLAFSAAALALSLALPAADEDTADLVASAPELAAAAGDVYGFGLEER